MNYQIHERKQFRYVDQGKGEIILLLHGLFGALSNWESVLSGFSNEFRIIVPLLPIYQRKEINRDIDGFAEYLHTFVQELNLEKFTLVGNSLGGHIALIYSLNYPGNVQSLVLTGSSGLYENSFGGSFPKRSNYEYIKERVEYTFFDPKTATRELVDEVYEIVNNPPKVIRVIRIARAAQKHNLRKELPTIACPVLLIWGLNDTITPPEIAHDFRRLIPDSKLCFIDHCGHAPMMEQPEIFNRYVSEFLNRKVQVPLSV